MRLKEDTTSWRVSALVKRDFKHDHSEGRTIYRSHKATRKWCRGKIGVVHNVAWRKKTWLFGEVMYVGTCSECSKRMYRQRLIPSKA